MCDDYWTSDDAEVVCKQLGLLPFGEFVFSSFEKVHNVCSLLLGATIITGGKFGSNPVKYWLDDLSCTEHEASLFECKHGGEGVHNCKDGERAGVSCLSKSTLSPPYTFWVFYGCQIGGLSLIEG